MKIVYDHDRVVVVDKDAGVSSEDVAAQLQKKLVHRIDRPTSGLLVLADDARTVSRLQKQLQAGGVVRTYVALAHGAVDAGVYEATLVRDRGDGRRGGAPADTPGGKAARLEVVAVDVRGGLSRVVVRLHTGRTHQIRIQLAEAGHPVVGEFVYGDRAAAAALAPRLFLHSATLRFTHPGKDKAVVDVEAAVPAVFDAVLGGVLGGVLDTMHNRG